MSYSRIMFMALIACLAVSYITGAGAQGSSGVRWFVEVGDADITHGSQAVRIYGTPAELTVFFSLSNDAGTPLVVTQAALKQDVRFVVTSGADVPVRAMWQSGIRRDGDPSSVSVASETPVHIEPRQTVEWTVILERADDLPFEQRSILQVMLREASELRETAKSTSWSNNLAPRATSIIVTTGPPSEEPRERGAAARQAGRKALREDRVEDAVMAFRSAVAAEPASRVSLIALGDAYVRAKRFSEAIAPLEKAMAANSRDRSEVPFQLAFAYVGIGDEAGAVRVLQTAGLSSDRVPGELTKLRDRLAIAAK